MDNHTVLDRDLLAAQAVGYQSIAHWCGRMAAALGGVLTVVLVALPVAAIAATNKPPQALGWIELLLGAPYGSDGVAAVSVSALGTAANLLLLVATAWLWRTGAPVCLRLFSRASVGAAVALICGLAHVLLYARLGAQHSNLLGVGWEWWDLLGTMGTMAGLFLLAGAVRAAEPRIPGGRSIGLGLLWAAPKLALLASLVVVGLATLFFVPYLLSSPRGLNDGGVGMLAVLTIVFGATALTGVAKLQLLAVGSGWIFVGLASRRRAIDPTSGPKMAPM